MDEISRTRENLHQILESVRLILAYTEGMTESMFIEDTRTVDAVVKRLEWIGEISKRIPESIRAANPALPWRDLARTRDFLSHHYLKVDRRQIWETVQDNLSSLEESTAQILRKLPG